jgi:hypothetical protein
MSVIAGREIEDVAVEIKKAGEIKRECYCIFVEG